VEELQKYLLPGHSMLDAGCGSGILSIVGLLLGADCVVACDVDPTAITATHKNAELNLVDRARLQVLHGNILMDAAMRDVINGRNFHVVVANIVADVIIALLPLLPALLKPGGYFICSGIIDDRVGDVLTALTGTGLALISNKALDGWHCLVCEYA
jgi:ribosomal protein L11 methyltransferase